MDEKAKSLKELSEKIREEFPGTNAAYSQLNVFVNGKASVLIKIKEQYGGLLNKENQTLSLIANRGNLGNIWMKNMEFQLKENDDWFFCHYSSRYRLLLFLLNTTSRLARPRCVLRFRV